MQVWELATTFENHRWAPVVLLSFVVKAREATLELDIATLNADDGMEKLYQKLDILFLEDANQAAFMVYESFEKYPRHPHWGFSHKPWLSRGKVKGAQYITTGACASLQGIKKCSLVFTEWAFD